MLAGFPIRGTFFLITKLSRSANSEISAATVNSLRGIRARTPSTFIFLSLDEYVSARICSCVRNVGQVTRIYQTIGYDEYLRTFNGV